MLPVIEVLEYLPTVETIDLSDNRLIDLSLLPLVSKLDKLPSLFPPSTTHRCRLKPLKIQWPSEKDLSLSSLSEVC
jgi:hypothetical protein